MDDEMSLAEWRVGPDWQIEKDDAHCLALGRVLARLHTVEVLIRLALTQAHEGAAGDKPSVAIAAFELLKAGDGVGIDGGDDFENYDSLRKLFKKFNTRFPTCQLNERLVVVRDALAHGRVLPVWQKGAQNLKLLKFREVEKHPQMANMGLSPRSATVAFAEVLTSDWFSQEEIFLDDQIAKVRAAALTIRRQKTRGKRTQLREQ